MQIPYEVFQWLLVIGHFVVAYLLFKLTVFAFKQNIERQKAVAFSKGLSTDSNWTIWKREGLWKSRYPIAKLFIGSTAMGIVWYIGATLFDKYFS